MLAAGIVRGNFACRHSGSAPLADSSGTLTLPRASAGDDVAGRAPEHHAGDALPERTEGATAVATPTSHPMSSVATPEDGIPEGWVLLTHAQQRQRLQPRSNVLNLGSYCCADSVGTPGDWVRGSGFRHGARAT